MKKFLLSLTIAISIGTTMSQPVNAAGITETPEGKAYNNIYRSSLQYLQMWGSLYESNIEGKISNLVIDGNDFYLYKPVETFATPYPYWIKGTLGEDNKVVFSFPQDAYIEPANQWAGTPESQTKITMFKVVTTDEAIEFVEDTDNTDLVMTWENNVLTQIDTKTADGNPRIAGIMTEEGVFNGSAEGSICWSVFDETLQTPPADLETTQYLCSSESNWGEKSNRIVEIGTKDNEFWIKGLYGYFADSWIKGTIDGDKVTIATDQYLGIYTTEMYYYFFQAAGTEEFETDWGTTDIRFIPEASVTLTKEGDKYVADKAMLMTFGMKTANPGMPAGSRLMNVEFSPYVEVPATPATPTITNVGEYYSPWGRSVTFDIPATDVDGNFINPDNMYYNIFINDELFTFTTDVYPILTEPITDIPYNFAELGVVATNGNSAPHTITLFIEELPVIAIQSAYTVNGVTHKSAISSTAGIDKVTDSNAVIESTEWYNLQGAKIETPAAGTIAIRRDRMSDGTVKATKIIIR